MMEEKAPNLFISSLRDLKERRAHRKSELLQERCIGMGPLKVPIFYCFSLIRAQADTFRSPLLARQSGYDVT